MYINNDIDYLNFIKEKEIIIFGAGIEGRRNLARMNGAGFKVIAFCDNDVKKQDQEIEGIPVISFEKLCEINSKNSIIIICSIFEREMKKQLLNSGIYNFISVSQIDFGGGENYYDAQYFAYQQEIGKFGGKVKVNLFLPYIKEEMTVVEFGSGGGIC